MKIIHKFGDVHQGFIERIDCELDFKKMPFYLVLNDLYDLGFSERVRNIPEQIKITLERNTSQQIRPSSY